MTATPSPMAALRSMMQSVDAGIENAIDAHGFSFSALTADEGGAMLHFAAPGSWHLTLALPPDGRSRVALRRGEADSPSVSLALQIEEGSCRDLPAALGIAMDLFTAIAHA
jgi:hypothetical protein